MIPGDAGEEGAGNGKVKRGAGAGGTAQWKRWMLPTRKVLGSVSCCTNKSKRDNDVVRVSHTGLKQQTLFVMLSPEAFQCPVIALRQPKSPSHNL